MMHASWRSALRAEAAFMSKVCALHAPQVHYKVPRNCAAAWAAGNCDEWFRAFADLFVDPATILPLQMAQYFHPQVYKESTQRHLLPHKDLVCFLFSSKRATVGQICCQQKSCRAGLIFYKISATTTGSRFLRALHTRHTTIEKEGGTFSRHFGLPQNTLGWWWRLKLCTATFDGYV